MWSERIAPEGIQPQLFSDLAHGERDEDATRALGLQGPDEAFDHSDAAVLADGAVAY
jgi:hypothetical protein